MSSNNKNVMVTEDDVRYLMKNLYSCNRDAQRQVLDTFYVSSSVFDDPLTTCPRRLDIIKQFYLIANLSQSVRTDIKQITFTQNTNNLNPTGKSPSFYYVYVDSIQHYTISSILPVISLRVVSQFKLIEKVIVAHEDVWSMREMITYNLWGIGWIYDSWIRPLQSFVFSSFYDIFYGLKVILQSELRKL